jgi:hypothetical protein
MIKLTKKQMDDINELILFQKTKIETLEKEIERLEREKKQEGDKYIKKLGEMDVEHATEINYLKEENRKLWYLIRVIIKDETVKPTLVKFNDGNEKLIDLFENRSRNSFEL